MKDISYALGLSMATNFLNSGINNLDIESFTKGISDIFNKKEPSMSQDEAKQIINAYFAKLQQEAGEKDKKAGAEFLKANKEKDGIFVTESGLQYEILTAGDGAKPKATDTVRCHYEGN